MLSEIAYESFKQDQLFFSKDVVTERIKEFLADTLDVPKGLNADDVLRAIEVQQGILVERATDAYSFSHLTLQEYLTALYIVEKRLEKELVIQYLVDERWREIFLLVSGIAKNPVSLLFEPMHQQSNLCIRPCAKVQDLVKWAAVNEESESKLYQRAGMIAIATALSNNDSLILVRSIIGLSSDKKNNTAIRHIIASGNALMSAIGKSSRSDIISDMSRVTARAYDSASAFEGSLNTLNNHTYLNANTCRSIANTALKQDNVLIECEAPYESWKIWCYELQKMWLERIKLDPELIDFSMEEASCLKKYLYAVELLIHCKQSAVRVSRTTWEALERRLLTWEEKEGET